MMHDTPAQQSVRRIQQKNNNNKNNKNNQKQPKTAKTTKTIKTTKTKNLPEHDAQLVPYRGGSPPCRPTHSPAEATAAASTEIRRKIASASSTPAIS